MAFYQLDEVFGYQDANNMKRLWADVSEPDTETLEVGEVWLDISSNPPLLKRYNGSGWDMIGNPDADTLDGLEAVSFVRSDANTTVSAHTTWQDNQKVRLGDNNDLALFHDGTQSWIQNFTGRLIINNFDSGENIDISARNEGGSDIVLMNLDPDAQQVNVLGNKVWHAGNDGSTSGLDADTVDGLHAASLVKNDADTTVSANTTWQDNCKVMLGNGGDLVIRHDGSNSLIQNYSGRIIVNSLVAGADISLTARDAGGTDITLLTINPDGKRIRVGADQGLALYNDGSATQLQVHNSPLTIRSFADGENVYFNLDNSSGTTKTMMTIDPDAEEVSILGNTVYHAGNLWRDTNTNETESPFIQTGNKSFNSANTWYAITFDVAYSTTPRIVLGHESGGFGNTRFVSTTSFQIYQSDQTGLIPWLAIGKKS